MFTRTKVASALPKQILHRLFLFHFVGVYSFDDDPTDPIPPQPGGDEQIVKKIKGGKKRVRRDAQSDLLDADRQAPIRRGRKRKGRSMDT